MLRFRKIAALSMAVAVAYSGSALALELGEISWKSTLNQPLNAEIALYDVKNVSAAELTVQLASPEEFDKAGIERPYSLADLVFTPVIRNGKGVIKVTSRNPIQEPYVDFLLNVSWSSGQMLREYTLLINPPSYTPAVTVAKRTNNDLPTDQSITKGHIDKPVANTTHNSGSQTASSLKVRAGDSLWTVAMKNRRGTSVHQAMLAIYQENQDAFIDGDMSRLKKGKVLRIPSAQQMRTKSRAEALAQVLDNVNSRGASQRQLVASKEVKAPTVPVEAKDQLSLVAPAQDNTEGKKVADSGSQKAVNLSTDLVQVEENLDATKRQNEELRSRISDLQSQINDIKSLITYKDNQLAALANMAKISAQQKDNAVDQNSPLTEPKTPDTITQ